MNKALADELFEYRDGALYWKAVRRGHKVGSVAGRLDTAGYWRVNTGGRKHLNHRIIFLMHYGYMPDFIDHIDGNRANNLIENLRESTGNQNQHNARTRKDNASGVKGVHLHKDTGKWCVQLKINGKPKHIGLFSELDVARQAVEAARQQLHGEFMNHG